MNQKGGVGPVGALFLFFVFLLVWFVWLGGWLNDVGQIAIDSAGLTGFEAFFFANLNFVVIICLALAMMAWSFIGASQ